MAAAARTPRGRRVTAAPPLPQARADFLSRVAQYEKVYETITDEEASGHSDAAQPPRNRHATATQPFVSEMIPPCDRPATALRPPCDRPQASGFEEEFDTNGGRLRYVQSVDAGRKLVASGCSSLLMSHLVSLLHSVHLFPRKASQPPANRQPTADRPPTNRQPTAVWPLPCGHSV